MVMAWKLCRCHVGAYFSWVRVESFISVSKILFGVFIDVIYFVNYHIVLFF